MAEDLDRLDDQGYVAGPACPECGSPDIVPVRFLRRRPVGALRVRRGTCGKEWSERWKLVARCRGKKAKGPNLTLFKDE